MFDWLAAAPAGLLGLALLFAGWPLFRVLLVLTGAWYGFQFGPELLAAFGIAPAPQVAWLAGVTVAVILGLLAWQLFSMALLLWGFFVGYGIGLALIDNVFIALGAGLVVALLALAAGRLGVILLTSLAGSWLLVNLVLQSVGPGQLPPGGLAQAPWGYAAVVAVTLFGVFVQLRLWPERRR